MLTSEITDEETIAEAQKGIFTGYSATTIPKEFADNVSFKSGSQGLLLKDIPNPVVFAVSLVRKPCVHDAKFCKLKHIQNEESDMNEEDKQFLQKLRETFSFKGDKHEEPEALSSDELKQELASFKSDFKSEIIAGVTQGVAQAIKEALSEPKKKPKKEEGEGEEEEGNTTSNNEGDTNSNNTGETDDKGEEGDAEDKNKNKKKKPPASTKGAKLHDGPEPPASTKSASQTVYEIMGRNGRGQRIKQ